MRQEGWGWGGVGEPVGVERKSPVENVTGHPLLVLPPTSAQQPQILTLLLPLPGITSVCLLLLSLNTDLQLTHTRTCSSLS